MTTPHYGVAFRKRYMGCPDARCYTLADHAGHDPHGPEHPDGWPTTPASSASSLSASSAPEQD